MEWVIAAAIVVQAVSAVVIARLTRKLVSHTRDYVNETRRLAEENRAMAKVTTRAMVVESVPVLSLTYPRREGGILGAWKNVGHGAAINVELAIRRHGGGAFFPSDLGESAIEYSPFQTLGPSETLDFAFGRRADPRTESADLYGWEFSASYRDVHGRSWLSHQRIGDNNCLKVGRIRPEANRWEIDHAEPLADAIRSMAESESERLQEPR